MQGRRHSKAQRIEGESGAALPEFSIILPLFLFLTAMVVDCGLMLNQYYLLTRISYTASRMTAEFPQLEKASVTNAQSNDGAHFNLQDQIRGIVDAYGNKLRAPVDITTMRLDDTQSVDTDQGGTVSFDSDIARVVLTMNHRTIWSRMLGVMSVPIVVESEGAYLLR